MVELFLGYAIFCIVSTEAFGWKIEPFNQLGRLTMRVSKSVAYGLLAVGYIAQHRDQGIILSQIIAKEYDISLEYLFKIMQELVRAQILRSKRGPRGGFSLARPLNKITMLDVIEALEGYMNVSLGLEEHAPKNKFAAKATRAYDKIAAQTRSSFKKVKISDLI
jgi:Rrf2 family protein